MLLINELAVYYKLKKSTTRYKTHDEQIAERRSHFVDRDVPIKGSESCYPVAPPRAKARRQTVQEFKKINNSNYSNSKKRLFVSEHRTDDDKDLLPVKKTIAFDFDFTDQLDDGEGHREGLLVPDDVMVNIIGEEPSKSFLLFQLSNHNEKQVSQIQAKPEHLAIFFCFFFGGQRSF